MRTLASIKRISSVNDIPGKDRIGLAMIDGWSVIVQKSEMKTGDLVVFCEIDSILPDKPEFEFLKNGKGLRIRTMKLSGVISQGICFPLSILPEGDYPEGTDVTDILGVTKWEPSDVTDVKESTGRTPVKKYPAFLMRFKLFRNLVYKRDHRAGKGFPEEVSKTDETRCLVGDTKVETNKGKIRIADIVNKNLDVLVKSYDESSGEIVYSNIVDKQKYLNEDDLYEIRYRKNPIGNRENCIVCTPDHKIMTSGMTYKKASDLKCNDCVYTSVVSYDDKCIPAVYGMLLGDSSVSVEKRINKDGTKRRFARVSFSQGERQYEYLKSKISMFSNSNDIKIRKTKSGYSNNLVYAAYLPDDYTITKSLIDDGALRDGKLVLTERYCDRLDDLSLAIWYLDDGCIRHRDDGLSPSVQISSNSFSFKENELLQNTLKNKFGIDSNIRKEVRNDTGKEYFSIYIPTESVGKFMETIHKYVPDSMRYKLTKEYGDEKCVSLPMFERKELLVTNEISSIKRIDYHKSVFSRGSYTYDLEIDNTHNFFANDILHHNCQNAPWYLTMDTKWTVTEKVDGQSGTFLLRHEQSKLPWRKKKLEYIVCSRNMRLFNKDNSSYWFVSGRYSIESVLKQIMHRYGCEWAAIQGECIAPGVQSNKYNVGSPDLYVFNLITSDRGRFPSVEGKEIIESFGMKWVPIIDEEAELPHTVEEMLALAHGDSKIGDTIREGLVCRSIDGKQSFKAVDPLFLIKYDA